MRVEDLEDLIDDFIERAHTMVWCNVATIDALGRVQSRLLHPIWDGPVGYIGSRRQSPKAAHLAVSPYVSLAYVHDIVRPVYAECEGRWCDDRDERRRVWDIYRDAPAPLGFDYGTLFTDADDERFGVLRVTPWRIKVQDSPAHLRVWTKATSA